MFGIPNLYLVAAAVVAFAGWTVVIEQAGEKHATRVAQVDALKAENATLKFDIQQKTQAKEKADADLADIEAQDQQNKEKIDAAETILARGYGCPSADELRWYASIGQAGAQAQPPGPASLSEAGGSAAAQNCDPWPIIAAREKAGRLSANSRITKAIAAWKAMQRDYAAGVVKNATK
jgi:hypothetical protein